MNAPLVSVCVPLYNGAVYLEECLAGIAGQTMTDFEVLIVDDGSTDDGPTIAQRWVDRDDRFRLHRNDLNRGMVANWNRCIELARGTWIKFVFQDDLMAANCLEAMLAAGTTGGGFAACARQIVYEGAGDPALRAWYLDHENAVRDIYAKRQRLTSEDYCRAKLSALPLNIVGEPSVTLIRRQLFDRFGGFDPLLVQLCDSEMWNRLACNVGIDYVPVKLVSFRVHRGSATHANLARKFRKEQLDEIVEWTRLCHSPHLAGFRRVAWRTGQWLGLRRALMQRTNSALEAARVARIKSPPDDALAREIDGVMAQLPGCRFARFAHGLYSVRRHFRALSV